jgi:hypothetical protein
MTTTSPIRAVHSFLILLGALIAPTVANAQGGGRSLFPTSLRDPRLDDLRRASASWDQRQGPTRKVVDQVCLVPDVATYYEALATWDEGHYFPILIDDVDLTFKFIQAFRPARIVRYPSRAKDVEGEERWKRAVKAVGDAWTAADVPPSERLRGDTPPTRLEKTPPGIVIAGASSPALPGLAALAAGRFQPLARLETSKTYGDILSPADLNSFVEAFDAVVRAKIPSFDRLGDDCDFVTLAGDYPYRYQDGHMAIDDRIARGGPGAERWAFTGRLMGDARRSVYAAMCSLFLQPESALLFSGYPEDTDPWRFYSLRPALDHLRPILPTTLATGERRATFKAWHEIFDPANRFGLLFINTKGDPGVFYLFGDQPASAFDIMPSVPTALCIIHSYSAVDPTKSGTIAGRWLDQGAFLYHGSVDEPFLPAFRPLWLVADLLAEGIPFGAATRQTLTEPFGKPWKLTLLGDPLYRLLRRGSIPARIRDYAPTAGWMAYAAGRRPDPASPEMTRLAWAINCSLVRLAGTAATETNVEIIGVLRTIDRGRLAPDFRPVFDELLVELLFRANRPADIRTAFAAIPKDERSATVTRVAFSAMLADLQPTLERGDFRRGSLLWLDLVRLEPDPAFVKRLISWVGPLATTPQRREEWLKLLRAAQVDLEKTDAAEVLNDEIKKVSAALRPVR